MDIWRRGITRRKKVPIKDYTGYVQILQGVFPNNFEKTAGSAKKTRCRPARFCAARPVWPGGSCDGIDRF